ncbi:MAG: hypothetical protein ABII27_03135 [bacterium]
MYQKILEMLLAKYGHLPYSELIEALRKDGLGEFVDIIENDSNFMKSISEIDKEFPTDLLDDNGYWVMPSVEQQIRGIPVDYHETFKFDHQACLKGCTGTCCKNKNYLMISMIDIFDILSASGAKVLGIHSTIDLFDRKPPLLELFYNEEYRMYLPYIRYLPLGVDLNTRPEDAKGSICPFLRPIHEVYSYHKKELPHWSGKDALGCILMEDKPAICRLSPLGKSTGMMTGKITYEYLPPAIDCPACESDVDVKVSDYVSSIISSSEEEQQKNFHKMLMIINAKTSGQFDQDRFNEIIKQVYNIDGVLSKYGLGLEHRPQIDLLVEIVFRVSKGDFTLYEHFIKGLSNKFR